MLYDAIRYTLEGVKRMHALKISSYIISPISLSIPILYICYKHSLFVSYTFHLYVCYFLFPRRRRIIMKTPENETLYSFSHHIRYQAKTFVGFEFDQAQLVAHSNLHTRKKRMC